MRLENQAVSHTYLCWPFYLNDMAKIQEVVLLELYLFFWLFFTLKSGMLRVQLTCGVFVKTA